MILRVPGRLDAVGSKASFALSQLASHTNYDLTVVASPNGTAFERLSWNGGGFGQERADFIAATGLGANIPTEYEQFWWTWYGTDTRNPTTFAWSTQAKLAVSALNPRHAAQLASGSGAGYGIDPNGITLPGDTLLSADIAE